MAWFVKSEPTEYLVSSHYAKFWKYSLHASSDIWLTKFLAMGITMVIAYARWVDPAIFIYFAGPNCAKMRHFWTSLFE